MLLDEKLQTITGALSNQKIARINLIIFSFKKVLNWDNLFLQLGFQSGKSVFFESDEDGESLRFTFDPLVDPFSGEQSEENLEFITTHGKWEIFDVTDKVPFKLVINKEIQKITPILNEVGKLVGIEIGFGAHTFVFDIEWDMGRLFWKLEQPIRLREDIIGL